MIRAFGPVGRSGRLWVLSVALSLLGGCAAKKPPPPPGPAEVGVVVMRSEPVALRTQLSARTSPYAVSEVRPQVAGIVQRRLFEEGSVVRAGQVLYQIDAAPYAASVAQAAASEQSARASVETDRLKSERYGSLLKLNAVSHQDADDASAAYHQAIALVSQQVAARRSAQINLDHTTVRAPISGRIGRSAFTQGALVTTSQADALTSIQTLDPIYVDITQTSTDMLTLHKALIDGQRGRGGKAFLLVSLVLGDGSTYPLTGRLTAREVTVDPTTGGVILRAIFRNPDGLLLPGMFVRATLSQGVPRSGVLVSQAAVTRDVKGAATVMIVDTKGRAVQRPVLTAEAVGDRWLVTSGLAPGDRVIVEGLLNVKPGAAVHAVPAGSASKPPAAAMPTGR